MNIFRVATEIFLIYILYKLIFDFVIPIYESTKKIKKQFGDIQQKMEQDKNTVNTRSSATSAQPKVKRETDYIDFEEVKK